MDCIFCKIVKGEIPSAKVFENEKVFAFLDINPLTKGHCLIIPRQHFENIFDIDEEILKEITDFAKKLSSHFKKYLNADGIDLVNANGEAANQTVFHFHLHVIPRYKEDGVEMNKWWQSKIKKATSKELLEIAEEIKSKI